MVLGGNVGMPRGDASVDRVVSAVDGGGRARSRRAHWRRQGSLETQERIPSKNCARFELGDESEVEINGKWVDQFYVNPGTWHVAMDIDVRRRIEREADHAYCSYLPRGLIQEVPGGVRIVQRWEEPDVNADLLEKLIDWRRHRYYGKYCGTVVDNADPTRCARLKVRVPSVLGEEVEVWAKPCARFARGSGGFLAGSVGFLPEPDSSVWVEFEAGDPGHPIWSSVFCADHLTTGRRALAEDVGDPTSGDE